MSLEDMGSDEVLALRFDERCIAEELAEWCGGSVERVATEAGGVVTTIWAPTEKGPRPAVLGNWIVKAADGTVSVMTGEDFAARHAPA